ncbi:MAG: hypothetical protein LBK53_03180 [Heliobacteriaceae bacterium]|nr:hypothetical protein [Heliobacteriaceae bacterium]
MNCKALKITEKRGKGLLPVPCSLFPKIAIIAFLALTAATASGYRHPDIFVIDAAKNAQNHNNSGIRYMNEKIYYAAIQEFKIAISLNPNTQATATYFHNLGKTYMLAGRPDLAQDCFERALTQYSLDFQYYKDLAECFKALNLINFKIKQYSNDKNPLNRVMLGLLYEEAGDLRRAIIILDEFAMSEPDLIITRSVKQEIKALIKKVNR